LDLFKQRLVHQAKNRHDKAKDCDFDESSALLSLQVFRSLRRVAIFFLLFKLVLIARVKRPVQQGSCSDKKRVRCKEIAAKRQPAGEDVSSLVCELLLDVDVHVLIEFKLL
jgi:hypothetical protein